MVSYEAMLAALALGTLGGFYFGFRYGLYLRRINGERDTTGLLAPGDRWATEDLDSPTLPIRLYRWLIWRCGMCGKRTGRNVRREYFCGYIVAGICPDCNTFMGRKIIPPTGGSGTAPPKTPKPPKPCKCGSDEVCGQCCGPRRFASLTNPIFEADDPIHQKSPEHAVVTNKR